MTVINIKWYLYRNRQANRRCKNLRDQEIYRTPEVQTANSR